jgi:hypothetical protein
MMRRRTGVDIEVSEVEIISHAEQLPFTAFGHARPDCLPLRVSICKAGTFVLPFAHQGELCVMKD